MRLRQGALVLVGATPEIAAARTPRLRVAPRTAVPGQVVELHGARIKAARVTIGRKRAMVVRRRGSALRVIVPRLRPGARPVVLKARGKRLRGRPRVRRGLTGAVKPTPDRARARSAGIGAAGGVLTATGADGTRYELSVPAGALAAPATITMTPLRRIRGLPLTRSTGVQLGPDGLAFARAATLKITLKRAAARGSIVHLEVQVVESLFGDFCLTEATCEELLDRSADLLEAEARRFTCGTPDPAQQLNDLRDALHAEGLLRLVPRSPRYTAPGGAGSCTVTARSVADTSRSAAALVVVGGHVDLLGRSADLDVTSSVGCDPGTSDFETKHDEGPQGSDFSGPLHLALNTSASGSCGSTTGSATQDSDLEAVAAGATSLLMDTGFTGGHAESADNLIASRTESSLSGSVEAIGQDATITCTGMIFGAGSVSVVLEDEVVANRSEAGGFSGSVSFPADGESRSLVIVAKHGGEGGRSSSVDCSFNRPSVVVPD